ncbi:MAG: hypothetical protein WCT10_05740 [Patescibacteria group bacterium]|jgi:hypothetical protein
MITWKFSKIRRALALLAYVFIACGLVYWARPGYLFSILIVLAPPAIINWLWLRESRGRVLKFAAVTTILFAPPVELASRLADAWDVQSMLPRPFGVMPLENLLFAFLNFFWALSFYEYFAAGDRGGAPSKRMPVLIGLYLLLDLVVFGLFAIDPAIVAVNYVWMAVPILIVPGALIFWRRPELLPRTVPTTLFFAAVFFIYEYVSLCIGSWWWPGHYVWTTRLCGRIFPIDDVIIWYFLSTPVLIGGYEYFVVERGRGEVGEC